jgi:branched-chain amino acid transport system permease protein
LLALPEARIQLGRLAPRYRVPRVPSLRRSVVGLASVVAVVGLVAAFGGLDTTNVRRLTLALLTGVIMLSLVPLTGWAGQISLAQITFVGIGVFAMAEVAGDAQSLFGPGNPLGLVCAAVLAAPFGVLMALPALRLQGLYLALASMAFAVMAVPLFFAQPEIFGASGRRLATPSFLGIDFADAHNFLVLAAVAFALVGLFVVWLRRGAFGRRLIALRDSPAGSAALGVNLVWTKLLVFALSAAMAGFGGGLFGMFRGTAGSMDFEMLAGITFLLLLVVGGVGTVSGALIGGLSTVALLIVQDEVTFVLFGVSVLVALTRIGPGLAAFGASRNPEGIVSVLGRPRHHTSRPASSERVPARAAPTVDAARDAVRRRT